MDLKNSARKTSPSQVENGQGWLFTLFSVTHRMTRQLCFSHSEDGLLGAQLILLSKSSVKVQYSISVLNHIDPNADIENCGKRVCDDGCDVTCAFRPGGSALFYPKTAGGNSKICSISEIRDRSNGFLSDDVFVVQLKIRQKMPENEDFKISSCSSSCTATVMTIPHPKDTFIVCP